MDAQLPQQVIPHQGLEYHRANPIDDRPQVAYHTRVDFQAFRIWRENLDKPEYKATVSST